MLKNSAKTYIAQHGRKICGTWKQNILLAPAVVVMLILGVIIGSKTIFLMKIAKLRLLVMMTSLKCFANWSSFMLLIERKCTQVLNLSTVTVSSLVCGAQEVRIFTQNSNDDIHFKVSGNTFYILPSEINLTANYIKSAAATVTVSSLVCGAQEVRIFAQNSNKNLAMIFILR